MADSSTVTSSPDKASQKNVVKHPCPSVGQSAIPVHRMPETDLGAIGVGDTYACDVKKKTRSSTTDTICSD